MLWQQDPLRQVPEDTGQRKEDFSSYHFAIRSKESCCDSVPMSLMCWKACSIDLRKLTRAIPRFPLHTSRLICSPPGIELASPLHPCPITYKRAKLKATTHKSKELQSSRLFEYSGRTTPLLVIGRPGLTLCNLSLYKLSEWVWDPYRSRIPLKRRVTTEKHMRP